MWDRFVTLIDMDCFYCQVEARLDPSLKGKPMAVVQYNTWKGGGIIAVNYEARNMGVTRRMRGDDAQKQCPDIRLVSVPEVRGKADLTKYREAGREVIAILNEFSNCVEKASIDEAYIDLSDLVNKMNGKVTSENLKSTFVVGYTSNEEGTKQWLENVYHSGLNDDLLIKLAYAANIVEKIRNTIFEKTGFHCSAGVSHNKILAKLACGLHKPNRQTVLPYPNVPILFQTLPVKKVRNLGGKFGDMVQGQLKCNSMSDVLKYSLKELQNKFGEKSGSWLYNISRGIDLEPVQPRTVSKSIGCCKNFSKFNALSTKKDVKHWLSELAYEIVDRLEDDIILNKRRATLLTVSAHQDEDKSNPFSRCTSLNSYKHEEIVNSSFMLLLKSNQSSSDCPKWHPPLKYLGISVSKFIDAKDSSTTLLNFFKPKRENNNCDKIVVVESTSAISNVKNDDSKATNILIPSNPINEIENTLDKNISNEKKQPEPIDYSQSFFCKYFKSKQFIKRMKTTNYFQNIINANDCAGTSTAIKINVYDDISNDSVRSREADEIVGVHENVTAGCSSVVIHDEHMVQNDLNSCPQIIQYSKHSEINLDSAKYCDIISKKNEKSNNIASNFALRAVKNVADSTDQFTVNKHQAAERAIKDVDDARIAAEIAHRTTHNREKARRELGGSDASTSVEMTSKTEYDTEKESKMEFGEEGDAHDDLVEFCTKCEQMIKLIDFLEHLDYHAARELHEELNKKPNTSSNLESRNNTSSMNISHHREKRKYKKHKNQNDNNMKKTRLITSFFSVKQ